MQWESPSNNLRGPPVSIQERDKFILDTNIGYAKSAFMQSQNYLSGPTSEKPYNTRLTDKVEIESVERNLSDMKRKTFTPANLLKTSKPDGKIALYDIRKNSLNEQDYIGNYLPNTLNDRNREKIYSSNTWSKNLDMMRAPGQTMSDIYNSSLLTTETNIPKALDIPSADERIRISTETYRRQIADENTQIQNNIRLRNSPEKIERERRQKMADVGLKNESIFQLGRYDNTATKFKYINECDIPHETILSESTREKFTAQSDRHNINMKYHDKSISDINKKNFIDENEINKIKYKDSDDYYKDTPGVKRKIYNQGNFIQLVKNGQLYEIYPDDTTTHYAPFIMTSDSITKKPIKTFATADNKNLYILQKRDSEDIYTLDGHKYDNDLIEITVPWHEINPIFREKLLKYYGNLRDNSNEKLLSMEYDDLCKLVNYFSHNEDKTERVRYNSLYNTKRDFNWNELLQNNYKDSLFFVHPNVIKEDRDIIRQKLFKERHRLEKTDNYIPISPHIEENTREISPISYEKKKNQEITRNTTRNEPFRGKWGFEINNIETRYNKI